MTNTREENAADLAFEESSRNYYQVLVGNLGVVYQGHNGFTANHTYSTYVHQSKTGYGRAANEPVTLLKNDEPSKEHTPLPTWNVFWSPEGRVIATVQAKDARAAVRKAPLPYRRYLGEMYAEVV